MKSYPGDVLFRYHLCLTVHFVPEEGAIRLTELATNTQLQQMLRRKIYVNGQLNFKITTKYLPEVTKFYKVEKCPYFSGTLGARSTNNCWWATNRPKQRFSTSGARH